MKTWLFLINDFAHDLFTGLWIASFFALSLVHTKYGGADQGAAAAAIVRELLRLFFLLESLSLTLIMVTGVFRFLHVKMGGGEGQFREVRKQLLIIKHVIMGVAFAAGSILGYRWTFLP